MQSHITLYLRKKYAEDRIARQGGKIPRTDRLDGGAKLDRRRRLAEEQRIQSSFNHVPQDVLCTHCGHQNITEVKKKRGRFTWLLCMFGCFWAPFCDCTKDTVHVCSNCHNSLCIVKKRC